MSEKQRLLPADRGEDIAEERESNGSESPTEENESLTAKIRRRQSPPGNNSAGNYGTISDIKYQPLIGPGAAAAATKTHFTRKQTLIAVIAFLLFAGGVAVTLILGLPRLEAKRREYFEAKFYESPLKSVSYSDKAVLLNSAPECSRLARDQSSIIDSASIAILCSLVSSPHLLRPDSRISGILIQNGTLHEISTDFESIPLQNRFLTSPILFQTLQKFYQEFETEKNFTDILQLASELAENGIPMTDGLANVINENLAKKAKWKSDFLQVTTSLDGTVRPGQIVKNPAFAQFLASLNDTNIQEILEHHLVESFGENVTLTEPEVIVRPPLKTDFFKMSVLTPNNGAGMMLNRYLRIQAYLNDQFEQCNDEARTLKDGTKEFHFLIESLKHSLEALTATELDTQHNIMERSRMIYELKENNPAPLEIKKYNYTGKTLSMIKSIQKQSRKRSFQLMIHDAKTGDTIVLVGQNRKDLFEGDKFASKTMGIVLDLFESNTKKEFYANPERLPTIVMNSTSKAVQFLLSSEYEACDAIAQVLSKLTLGCQSLKTAVDESRIYFVPKKNQVLIEDKFPRAYIDLLMRLYGHTNLQIVLGQHTLSSVYAMHAKQDAPADSSTLNMLFKKLSVFFDWRSNGEGFLNGV